MKMSIPRLLTSHVCNRSSSSEIKQTDGPIRDPLDKSDIQLGIFEIECRIKRIDKLKYAKYLKRHSIGLSHVSDR
jgi:hypothetical protein